MDVNERKDKSKFLLATYKECLVSGIIETPDQFLLRMNVEPEVEAHVKPNLEQMKKFYDEKNS